MIRHLKFLTQIIITIIVFLLSLIGLAAGIAMLFLLIGGILGMALCFLCVGNIEFWEVFIIAVQGAVGIFSIAALFAIGQGFYERVMEWLD